MELSIHYIHVFYLSNNLMYFICITIYHSRRHTSNFSQEQKSSMMMTHWRRNMLSVPYVQLCNGAIYIINWVCAFVGWTTYNKNARYRRQNRMYHFTQLFQEMHSVLSNYLNQKLTFWRRNFFQILAHPVFKMWVIQKPNKVALWNKRRCEGKKWRL